MTLEELKVIITAETSGLKKELNSLQSQVNKTQKSVDKSTNKISSGFSKLTKAVSLTAITVGLYKFGKAAVNAASDLQEVQNVVDVAFGKMSSEVDEFAKNASQKFGLSELQAKQFASTFMAMSNGMGIAAETGKAMSLTLTQLAGDMASFYNVSQDVADTALNSVFTGETETLKKFGVVMTEANLSAYAMSKGITKAYSDMTQAEKVILRYSFVLNSTKNAQGDYARTCNNWANQVRLLKNQFTDLLAIIGGAFMKVLTPVIQVINLLLQKIITLANVIAEAFGGTGIKEIKASTGDASSSTEDMSNNLSDSNKEAKKLKSTLAGFDQLNVLSDPSDSSSSGSGGVGTGVDSNIAALATETYDVEPDYSSTAKFDAYCKSISDIFHKWFDNLPKLEINFDGAQALADIEKIGLDITNVIAGWGSFVITIGINILNDLNIGQLVNDFLSLVSSITGLASTLTDILVPAFESFYGVALKPIVEWVGEKLSNAFKFAKGVIDDFATFLEEHKEGIQGWIELIGKVVNILWKVIEPIADVVWETFKGIILALYEAVKFVLGAFTDLGELLNNILDDPQHAFEYFVDFVKERFLAVGDYISGLFESVKIVFKGIAEFAVTRFKQMIEGGKAAVTGIKDAFKSIPNWFKEKFTEAWTNVKNVFSKGGKVFTGIKDGILNGLKAVVNALIKGMNKVIRIPFNGINAALKKIKNISFLGISPFKNLINTISIPQIPTLAKGGVITAPTIAMMGEYAGASSNPEIVTPQSILKETINSSNENLIATLFNCTYKLIQAVESNQMSIEIDGQKLFNTVRKEANTYSLKTGKTAFI